MSISFEARNGVSVIEISGKLSADNSDGLTTRVQMWLNNRNPAQCVFDLSALELLDSSGVGAMVVCRSHARKWGGDVYLAGAQGKVEMVLKLARVTQLFPMYDTAKLAAEAFPPPLPDV